MHLNSLVFVPILRLRWAGMHPSPSSNMRANKKWLWRDELQSKPTKTFTENSCIKRSLSLKGPGIITNLNQFWLRNPTQSNHSIWHLIALSLWGFAIKWPGHRGCGEWHIRKPTVTGLAGCNALLVSLSVGELSRFESSEMVEQHRDTRN